MFSKTHYVAVTLTAIFLFLSCGKAHAGFLGYITLPNGPGSITSDGLGGREFQSMSFGLVAAPGWPENPILPRATSCIGCDLRIELGGTDTLVFDSANTAGFDDFASLITNDVSEFLFSVADYYGDPSAPAGGFITGGGGGFMERVVFSSPEDLVGSVLTEVRAIPLLNEILGSVSDGYVFESLVRWEFYGEGPGFADYTAFDPPASVPEPSTLGILGAGLLWIAVSRRRAIKELRALSG
jgi:hypothetical protein